MRNTFLKFILLKIIELEPLCISLWTVSFWSLFIYLAKGNQTSPCPILFPICLLRVLFLNVSSHCRAVCGIGLREWTVSALILDTFGSLFVFEGLGYRKEKQNTCISLFSVVMNVFHKYQKRLWWIQVLLNIQIYIFVILSLLSWKFTFEVLLQTRYAFVLVG